MACVPGLGGGRPGWNWRNEGNAAAGWQASACRAGFSPLSQVNAIGKADAL